MKTRLNQVLLLATSSALLAGGAWSLVGLDHPASANPLTEAGAGLLSLALAVLGGGGFLCTWWFRHEPAALLQTFWTTLVTGLGCSAALTLLVVRPEQPRREAALEEPTVLVQRAIRSDVQILVTGHGTVRAKVRAHVVPQVPGRVVAIHPHMVSGGRIKSGEPLLTIEPADHELALRKAQEQEVQAAADVATAEARIEESHARLKDAEAEVVRTQELVKSQAATDRELNKVTLALQIAQAQTRITQAGRTGALAMHQQSQVAVDQARLNLGRTQIALPFEAVVVSEQVDVGQYLNAGTAVAEVYGTLAVEIPLPLEEAQLAWLACPPTGPSPGALTQPGAAAVVYADSRGQKLALPGRVVRTEAEVDARSRMVHVVVEVQNPFAQELAPLLPGAFVRVDITGHILTGVIPLPLHALQYNEATGNEEIWVVRDGRLHICGVAVVRRDQDRLYVSEGIADGDWVVLTPLEVVTEGMRVRPVPVETAQANPAAPENPAAGTQRPK